MRNTRQRELILSIIDNSYNHPSAYDIYNLCKKKMKNISLGTVYRNLNYLFEQGLIRRINMPDGSFRFDRCSKHNHFICNNCDKVVDVYNDINFDKNIISDNLVIDYEIYFRGKCKDCIEEE